MFRPLDVRCKGIPEPQIRKQVVTGAVGNDDLAVPSDQPTKITECIDVDFTGRMIILQPFARILIQVIDNVEE